MKKAIALILFFAVLAAALFSCTGNESVTTDTGATGLTAESVTENVPSAPGFDGAVTALRVNYEIEPNCIDGTPVFSWATDSAVRGTVQNGYRITVAKTEAALD